MCNNIFRIMPGKRARKGFEFFTTTKIVEYTGRRASAIEELLKGIKEVDGSVIFHHTHHFIQQLHFVRDEPRNDFAYWVLEALDEPELAEILNSIDPTEYDSIRELRNKIIEEIEKFLKTHNNQHKVSEDKQFYFLRTNTFVFSTKLLAWTLDDFVKIIEKIGYNSIYYHLFESRLQKEQREDDFVLWFRDELELPELAEKMKKFDIYTSSLSDIRTEILRILREYHPENIFEKLRRFIKKVLNLFEKK